MTVVNPKSISGINSITTGSGSDDILTIHNNNGTERLRIDSTGTTKITTGIVTTLTATSSAKVGSGVTLSPDGDVFATGVCTATSFVGSGANLTGISQVSLSGSTDNTIVTVTGANAIAGESTLTYDAGGMNIAGDTDRDGIKITQSGNNYGEFNFNSNRSSAGNALGVIRGEWNSSEVASIYLSAGDDTTNKDDGQIKFYTSAAGGSIASRMEILNDGDVKVTDGDLVIGTSGHGIDFSATGGPTNGSGTSELLDDYEEGTFTPTARGNNTNSSPVISGSGNYIKIGNMVQIRLSFSAENGSYLPGGEYFQIHGLPFTASGTHSGLPFGMNYKVVFDSSYQYYFYMPSGGTILWGYYNRSDLPYQPWGTDQWDNTQWYHESTFTYMTS